MHMFFFVYVNAAAQLTTQEQASLSEQASKGFVPFLDLIAWLKGYRSDVLDQYFT